MTRVVRLLPTAESDLAAAKQWYRQCHPYLEADLIFCVEETLERIARNPRAFVRVEGEFRQAFVHRFPYRIIYRLVGDQIVVAAILHTSRHPRTWFSRGH